MLKTLLNLIGKVTGHNDIGDLVGAALAAKDSPTTENIHIAEVALESFLESEVSAPIAEDIHAAQPIVDSVFAFVENPTAHAAIAKQIGAGVINFAKHFRPEIPQEDCDNFIAATSKILSDEGI